MSATAMEEGFRVAVLIPCRNQAATIGGIVRGFADALPDAKLYVFDNSSTDDTARLATREGARVYREARLGKENVVRRMFADIDADIYVLADGDGSYDPADAPSLINALITEHVDMVVGTRRRGDGRAPNSFADSAFDWLYRRFFVAASTDLVSGYRAFTRRFVKSFPALASGFDIEIELSMHASQLMIPVAEIALSDDGRDKPASATQGAAESLRGFSRLAILLKETRPFAFFAMFAVVFWGAGLALMLPALTTRLQGGDIDLLSNALFGMALLLAGFIMAGCGLILDALGRSRVEQKRILFQAVPGLGAQ